MNDYIKNLVSRHSGSNVNIFPRLRGMFETTTIPNAISFDNDDSVQEVTNRKAHVPEIFDSEIMNFSESNHLKANQSDTVFPTVFKNIHPSIERDNLSENKVLTSETEPRLNHVFFKMPNQPIAHSEKISLKTNPAEENKEVYETGDQKHGRNISNRSKEEEMPGQSIDQSKKNSVKANYAEENKEVHENEGQKQGRNIHHREKEGDGNRHINLFKKPLGFQRMYQSAEISDKKNQAAEIEKINVDKTPKENWKPNLIESGNKFQLPLMHPTSDALKGFVKPVLQAKSGSQRSELQHVKTEFKGLPVVPSVQPYKDKHNGDLFKNTLNSEAHPVIKVTIGRIDVRAISQPVPGPVSVKDAPKPRLSLDEYLKQRNKG